MKHYYLYYSYEEWGRGYIGKRACDCLPEEDVKYFGSFVDETFKPKHKIILSSDYSTPCELAEDEIILHDFYDVARNPHFVNRAKATSTGFDTTGTTLTDETKLRIGEARRGKTHTKQAKLRIGEARRGKTHTDEAKRKIGEALAGEKNSRFGKTLTDETKQKMREAQTGKKRTDSTRQKLREANTGEKNPMYGKTGENNPMFGKTHTDEIKQLLRDVNTGENNPMFGRTGECSPVYGKKWYVNAAGETRQSREPPGPEWQASRKWKPLNNPPNQ